MANLIRNKIRQLEAIRSSLRSEGVKIAHKYDKEIIRLNSSQFESGMGSDNNRLVNDNPIFKGRYTIYTQAVARNTIAPKTAGSLYNFAWTGDFLSGMYVDINQDGTYKVYSTGIGTGEKLFFFKGYKNLFGLNDKNQKEIKDKISGELRNYIKSKL